MPCFPPKMVTSSFIKILYSRIGCPFVAAMTISCVWDPFEASKSLEEPINWAVFNRTLKGTSGGVFVCFCSCLIVFLTVCSCLFCRFPFSVPDVIQHPPPDTPQKKNQKTRLGDPQNYQVEGIDIPKQEVAKSSQSRFFNKINSKTL